MVFLFNLSLALVARVMPQINVFFVAVPVQLALVFLFLVLTVPYAVEIMNDTLREEVKELLIYLGK